MKPVADPPKQRLFIYDRKEMAVLVLLGVMVALFAFTLGVHLGKKVNPIAGGGGVSTGAHPAKTEHDQVPENPEIAEQTAGARDAVDEKLDQALQEEVDKTGIKLDEPRQVDLPKETKSGSGGATTQEAEPAPGHKVPQNSGDTHEGQPSAETHGGTESAAPQSAPASRSEAEPSPRKQSSRKTPSSSNISGKYTLQVGSHRVRDEAESQIRALEIQGLKPFARTVDLKGKGRWHRVFIGGYPTLDEAEKAGSAYRADGFIESFVVAPRPN